MNNLKEAKELLEKYKSITLEELRPKFKLYKHRKGRSVLESVTGFGTIYCILCKSVYSICNNCIYSFREDYEPYIPCVDIIYNEMESASSAEELFNAIQKRISYLNHIIEWYETMDREYSSDKEYSSKYYQQD